MSLDLAIRLSEILLALTFLQQSVEHFRAVRGERVLFIIRFALSIFLLFGMLAQWVLMALAILSVIILRRFGGPYNGGSDRMGLLILWCLCVVHFMPDSRWQEYVFGYLAVQLVLSYFMSGWVKVVNQHWRSGRALCDVFVFSAYPVSERSRRWADRPLLLMVMSWMVIMFELLFPLSLMTHISLIVALAVAAVFHFANACLFGLNRFFWVWLAAYPSLIWLQQRVFDIG